MPAEPCKLQWTQHLALVQHDLHIAHQTRSFSFFKQLQLSLLLSGTDHVGTLTEAMADSDSADALVASLDRFNAVIAHVHEDAFKNVYDTIRANQRAGALCAAEMPAPAPAAEVVQNSVRVFARKQRATANESIHKMFEAASALIEQQPGECHHEAVAVFTLGTTFVADAIEVCLRQMAMIEKHPSDQILLEDSWTTVQSTVASAVTAMKCVFKLMAAADPSTLQPVSESALPNRRHQRSPSVDLQTRSLLRRMSTALSLNSLNLSGSNLTPAGCASPSRKSSAGSLASSTSPFFRQGFSLGSPAPPRSGKSFADEFHSLDPIPPTPADLSPNARNPFDALRVTNEEAFASNAMTKSGSSSNSSNESGRSSNEAWADQNGSAGSAILLPTSKAKCRECDADEPAPTQPQLEQALRSTVATRERSSSPLPAQTKRPRRRSAALVGGRPSIPQQQQQQYQHDDGVGPGDSDRFFDASSEIAVQQR